jgi:hypothetical protein
MAGVAVPEPVQSDLPFLQEGGHHMGEAGCSVAPSVCVTTCQSSSARTPRRSSSSTAMAGRATVRLRPLLASFSRIAPASVCSVLATTASCPASKSVAFHRRAVISPRRRLLFIPFKFNRPRGAPMRPFWIRRRYDTIAKSMRAPARPSPAPRITSESWMGVSLQLLENMFHLLLKPVVSLT